jgi:hypothetical protein
VKNISNTEWSVYGPNWQIRSLDLEPAGRGTRRAITAKCAETDDATAAPVSLPAGRLLVSKGNPCLAMLQADGAVLGSSPASRRFRNQKETFSVSADGTIIDFGFERGKSPFRFDLRALKLSDQRPADGRTPQPNQNGLRSKIGPSTLWHRRQNPRRPQGPDDFGR